MVASSGSEMLRPEIAKVNFGWLIGKLPGLKTVFCFTSNCLLLGLLNKFQFQFYKLIKESH
jgi:hypothetical protein